jgi:hypothetical protein
MAVGMAVGMAVRHGVGMAVGMWGVGVAVSGVTERASCGSAAPGEGEHLVVAWWSSARRHDLIEVCLALLSEGV